jgi:histidine triad (HIT) family protein
LNADCVFCKIARGEAPAWKIFEDNDIMVILDIFPVQKGHMLVISREHYESVHDAPPCVTAKLFTVAAALVKYLREELEAPGVNVIANDGRAAGQEIFHVHVHVIPRWKPGGWRALISRHPLTSEEASEVIEMMRGSGSIIRMYLEELKNC